MIRTDNRIIIKLHAISYTKKKKKEKKKRRKKSKPHARYGVSVPLTFCPYRKSQTARVNLLMSRIGALFNPAPVSSVTIVPCFKLRSFLWKTILLKNSSSSCCSRAGLCRALQQKHSKVSHSQLFNCYSVAAREQQGPSAWKGTFWGGPCKSVREGERHVDVWARLEFTPQKWKGWVTGFV